MSCSREEKKKKVEDVVRGKGRQEFSTWLHLNAPITCFLYIFFVQTKSLVDACFFKLLEQTPSTCQTLACPQFLRGL